MNQELEFDIVIAGGGMVGISLARLLADLGTGGRPCRIALLDRVAFEPDKTPFHAQPERYDPRVSALTQASKALFSELRSGAILPTCGNAPMTKCRFGMPRGPVRFSFGLMNPSIRPRFYSREFGHLSALHQGLSEQSNLTYFAPFNLTSVKRDESDTLLIGSEDGSAVRAKLLVAADGANSRIRQLAGFATREWDYGHDAIVTTVQTEKPHRATAWQRFIHTGPLAFLPLAGDGEQRHCSIVWSVVTNEAERLMGLSEAQFNEALTHAFESKLGAVRSSDKRFRVPLRQRHATEYFRDGIVLVGDAAHSIHPLAGQGVNLGFLDVIALSEELWWSQIRSSGKRFAHS